MLLFRNLERLIVAFYRSILIQIDLLFLRAPKIIVVIVEPRTLSILVLLEIVFVIVYDSMIFYFRNHLRHHHCLLFLTLSFWWWFLWSRWGVRRGRWVWWRCARDRAGSRNGGRSCPRCLWFYLALYRLWIQILQRYFWLD